MTQKPSVEVEIVTDDDFNEKSQALRQGKKVVEEKPSKPSKKATAKKSSKKKTTKKKKKTKEKKPPKPLTLHKNYLIDIRRHKGFLKINEDWWGAELVIRHTEITVNSKKVPAITIAIPEKPS